MTFPTEPVLPAGSSNADSATMTAVPPLALGGVLDRLSDAVVVTDENWNVRYLNQTARRFASANVELSRPTAVGKIFNVVDATGSALFDREGRPVSDLTQQRELLALRRPDRRVKPVALEASVTAGDRGPEWTLVLRDRSGESGLMARLNHQASHDGLTTLLNRPAFEQRLAAALDASRSRPERPGAVLYLDLDQFKIVNDTCGHDAGDAVLCAVAEALVGLVHAPDVVARLGGDEFAVLLRECTLAEAHAVATELRAAVAALICDLGESRIAHTVSIGITPLDGRCPTTTTVLSAADVACVAAKERGRDRIEVYGDSVGLERQAQMRWVSRVRRACDEQRFVLYRQPIVPLHKHNAGERPHYELLLRMVDGKGKIIMPAAFIHAAERYNTMSRVDRWTVRHVLEELVWREDRAPQSPYLLSVNLSGTSLSDPQFRKDVLAMLDRKPVAPGTLCFEVTETATVRELGAVALFMHALRERGCLFSLDDFGTGMASFAYLKDLPVDFLKIDGHFVGQCTADPASASMVRAFCDIARALNIRTVGERVEDAQTVSELRALGVDFAQGFHFERPRKLLNRLAFVSGEPAGARARVAV